MDDTAEVILRRWHDDLAAWAIPDEIRSLAERSPWELPRRMFANRARNALAAPSGVSYERAAQALPSGGTVLDVGCGAGAASLPLAAARVIGVDAEPGMLAEFEAMAEAAGRQVEVVQGAWPQVGLRVPAVDVVVCHHVLYNVPDLASFVTELTRHAHRRVVVEVTAAHPMSDLNPLWERLHGLRRPQRPTAADAVSAIRALGLLAESQSWTRPTQAEFGSYQEMLDVTGQRLCLPARRAPELDAALRERGVDPNMPRLGPPERRMVTIWWPGAAS